MSLSETPSADNRRRPHYAQYSQALIEHIAVNLPRSGMRILDPMAGVGTVIRQLELAWVRVDGERVPCNHTVHTVELENEWVSHPGYRHPRHHLGDSTKPLPFERESFDAIVTSPSFGNRDADRSHGWADQSGRRTYEAALGRSLSEETLVHNWGEGYRKRHAWMWKNVLQYLAPEGLVLLNIKDHPRAGDRMPVTGWHVQWLVEVGGLLLLHIGGVPTTGRPSGSNTQATTMCGLVDPLIILQKV